MHGRGLRASVIAALGGVLFAATAANVLELNSAATGFLLLIAVLLSATWGGLAAGLVASFAASASYTFFLPPLDSVHVRDPENWLALAAFLTTATLASRLVTRARELAERAAARAREVLELAGERERLLTERAHLEALRESEAMTTAVLRAVAHDLSTPLTAIRLEVGALKRLVSGDDARRYLDELDEETARLARRIEDLLALARLEAGSVRPHPEPVPPADLFRAARESLPRLDRPLVVSVAASCPDALADPALALEIIVNLLENAHRSSPDGEPIELTALVPASGRVRLGVLDRGRGIEGATPGREIAGDDLPSGGLGLEIARRFTTACAGRLALEPRAGGGVAAWVELPSAEAIESR